MARFEAKQINKNIAAPVAVAGFAVSTAAITATTISFTATDTISDSGTGFAFAVGDKINISGTASNNGVFTILTAAAGTLTVAEAIATEGAGASMTIEVVGELVTSELTTSALTAGNNGTAVTDQASTGFDVEGWLNSASNNIVTIADNTTEAAIEDDQGREVFARLTEDTGAFTLNYYVLIAGTETPHNFDSAASLKFIVQYNYEFKDLPYDFNTRIPTNRLLEDPSTGAGGSDFEEDLTIASLNTYPDLTKTPVTGTKVAIYVRGKEEGEESGSTTRSGKALTWVSGTAEYDLETTDSVYAKYKTFE